MFDGSSILITGGTGSFGRSMVAKLLNNFSPKRVVVYSRDELKQYEMRNLFPQKNLAFVIGDVRDFCRVQAAISGVDYVIHAAALKRVEVAEHNPAECIKTNIVGAENVILACKAGGVKKVVALSTDKAAQPINVYGASKLVSDKLFVAANNDSSTNAPLFSCVRYGNVIGSRGSVVPYFQSLVKEGAKEIPITDPRMTRFLITLDEGVDFVLQSFGRMQGGEIFVPKLRAVSILQLAQIYAPDLKVKVTGIRPGEKLHEVLCPADEAHRTLEFSDHYVICPSIEMPGGYVDYTNNPLNETGRLVCNEFEYTSKNVVAPLQTKVEIDIENIAA